MYRATVICGNEVPQPLTIELCVYNGNDTDDICEYYSKVESTR